VALKELKIVTISKKELEKLVRKVVKENLDLVKKQKERAAKPLMGIIMKKVRGRVDGKLVNEILMNEVNKYL
jgi:glutamyl-tRNA(Gln) amidotransferase subunit E